MLEKKCIFCGKSFSVRNYREKTAFYCSRDCFKKAKGLLRGVEKICLVCKKKFKAKSGSQKYCSSVCFGKARRKQWRKKSDKQRFGIDRKKILEKANYKCSKCGSSLGTRLHVHHKDGEGRTSSKPNNYLSNFIVLCASCHAKEEWKMRMEGKWSLKYDKCVECGLTNKKHYGHGYCKNCYTRKFS